MSHDRQIVANRRASSHTQGGIPIKLRNTERFTHHLFLLHRTQAPGNMSTNDAADERAARIRLKACTRTQAPIHLHKIQAPGSMSNTEAADKRAARIKLEAVHCNATLQASHLHRNRLWAACRHSLSSPWRRPQIHDKTWTNQLTQRMLAEYP